MNVVPGAHVHFAGAPWPVAQAENKLSSGQMQKLWKTRVKKITRVLSREDAAERKNVRKGKDVATGARQSALGVWFR